MINFIKNLFKRSPKLYSDLNSEEFKTQMKSSAVVIDVRTPAEFKNGKISKAKNINVASFNFMKEIKNIDSTKHIMVYCRSGARSAKAAKMITKLGFKNVSNLKGGILAWQNHNEKIV